MKKHSRIWIASNISGANATMQEFSAPEVFYTRENYLTVMPASGSWIAEVLQHGETLNDTWTVVANNRIFHDRFNYGDRFYLEDEAPDESLERTNGYGSTANAEVVGIADGDTAIVLTLHRNQKQVKN